MSAGGVMLFAALAAGLAWLFARPRRPQVPPELTDPNIDISELQAAENDLEDLDVLATPDEAREQSPDWGPGAPKP